MEALIVVALPIAWAVFWCWACVEMANRQGLDPEWWGIGGFMLGPLVFIAVLIKSPETERPVAVEIPAPLADPATAISALADLHARGAVTDEEFAAKKRELLERI